MQRHATKQQPARAVLGNMQIFSLAIPAGFSFTVMRTTGLGTN